MRAAGPKAPTGPQAHGRGGAHRRRAVVPAREVAHPRCGRRGAWSLPLDDTCVAPDDPEAAAPARPPGTEARRASRRDTP